MLLAVGAVGGLVYAVVVVTFGFSPRATDVGYQPRQPVAYSHAVHVGKLGIDCLYCHTGVETGASAAVPPTQTCMNCHTTIKPFQGDPAKYKLEALVQSFETGEPLHWVRVHDLPDFVYFNHSAHVLRGVGCSSCHGRIDTMETVYQAEPLSMGWCLDCHRNPDNKIRPANKITKMDWTPEEETPEVLAGVRARVNPPTDCSTCHR